MLYDDLFKKEMRVKVEMAGIVNDFASFSILGPEFVKLPSNEYALMKGKEVIEHCEVKGYCGQAFTDEPRECTMRMLDLLKLDLNDKGNRALFFSSLNAVMGYLGEVNGTIHCVGRDAERCGELLASEVVRSYGKIKVLHVGYQPSHVKALSKALDILYVTDLNPENVGQVRFGIKILDATINEDLISKVDLALITGSSVVNGTLFDLLKWCDKYNTKYIVYGVTIKGAAKILNLNVFCPFARNSLPQPLKNDPPSLSVCIA